jgi:hypothetical protein
MSPRRNWDSPTPLSQASVPLPTEPKGGHTRLRVSPNSDDWLPTPVLSPTLPFLCVTGRA